MGLFSVKFRRHEPDILAGRVPESYRKILPLIPGESVLEIGAGEGVLSLALAAQKERVIAIDLTPARVDKGKQIQSLWRNKGIDVDRCELILGDIFERTDLLDQMDTLIACRVIYYFRERIDELMALARTNVTYVCLIGNAARNRRRASGEGNDDIGEYDYYSTVEGMRELLERYDFAVTYADEADDPVVIGRTASAAS